MSKVLITDTHLTNIADAIRSKNGEVTTYKPKDLSTAIENLPSGGDNTTLKGIIDKSITEISNSDVAIIGTYVFSSCSYLTTVNFPKTTSINNYAFTDCASLKTAYFPNVTAIGNEAFSRCVSLTTVDFHNATIISDYAFASCKSLSTLNFPNVTFIGGSAFAVCKSLTAVILRNTTKICSLSNIDGFNTSGVCYIYVPLSLLDQYKVATNWVSLADRIRAIEDYPEICDN